MWSMCCTSLPIDLGDVVNGLGGLWLVNQQCTWAQDTSLWHTSFLDDVVSETCYILPGSIFQGCEILKTDGMNWDMSF